MVRGDRDNGIVDTNPAAIPILSTTSCQYLVESPIKIKERENTNTEADNNSGRDTLQEC